MLPKYQTQMAEMTQTTAQQSNGLISPLEAKIAEKHRLIQQCRSAAETCAKGVAALTAGISQLERKGQAEKAQFQKVKDQYSIQFQAQAKIMSTLSMTCEQMVEWRFVDCFNR
jgi:hypothetical protein